MKKLSVIFLVLFSLAIGSNQLSAYPGGGFFYTGITIESGGTFTDPLTGHPIRSYFVNILGTRVCWYMFDDITGGLYDCGDVQGHLIRDKQMDINLFRTLAFTKGQESNNINNTQLTPEISLNESNEKSAKNAIDNVINLKISPNPANYSYTIDTHDLINQVATIGIYNSAGTLIQTLYTGEITRNELAFSSSELNNDTYYIVCRNLKGVFSNKIIIQK